MNKSDSIKTVRLIFYYSSIMNKISLAIISSFTLFCFNSVNLFAHDEHDNPCRKENINVFREYTKKESFTSTFENRFNISFEKFSIANRLYSEALEVIVSDSLCKPNGNNFNIDNFVFNYVDTYRPYLEFNFDPSTNYLLRPGKFATLVGQDGQFPITKAMGEPCTNADFEAQNYSGWQTLCGKVNSSSYDIINQTLYTPGIGQSCLGAGDQHLIILGGVDPLVPTIPMVNPNGGSATVRIGDGTNINAYGAVLRQTFLVDANSSIFSYSYAAVLEDPGHSPMEQPFFRVRITDQNGTIINCGNYQAYAADGQYGWVDLGSYVYKNWSTTMVNLSSYVGQNVTVEFIVGDCSLTGHYGYAYVEASCSPSSLTMAGSGICIGQTTTINAPPHANGYSWNTGENTQSINVTTPGTYQVTLTSLQGAQCNITLSATVVGYQSPVADFSYTTKPCRLDSISFVNNSTLNGGSINSVRWNFGDGVITPFGTPSNTVTNSFNTIGTYNNPYHTYGNTQTYNVTLTVIGNNGCTTTVTKPVTMSTVANVNAGPDQTVCSNIGVTLNATGGSNYTWSNGIANGTHVYPPVGTNTYVVTTNQNGCNGTDTITIYVIQAPTINAGPDTTICSGQQITLSATGVPMASWTNGVSNNVPFIPNATNTYIASYTSPNGCYDNDTVTVTVNPTPTVSVTTPINTCSNNAITLNANGATNYVWSPNVQNGVPFYLAAGQYTYTVVGTVANGCSDSAIVQINVDQAPNVNAGQDQDICIGQSTTLTGSGNAPSYSWNNGVINNVPFSPQTSQSYIVSYTSPNGCTDSDTIIVNVHPLPTINAGQDFTVCENQTITLSGSGGVSYTWNNGVTNGVPFLQNVPTQTYTVTGTDQYGCTNTDQVTVNTESAPTVDAGQDFSFCGSTTQTINATSNVNPVNWVGPYTNGSSYTFNTSGYLVAFAQSANGCITYDTLYYTSNPLPNVNAGPDVHICNNVDVILTATGADVFTWSPNIDNGVPFTQTNAQQMYVVTGVDANGCIGSDTVWVYTYQPVDANFTASPMTGEAPLPVSFVNNSTGAIIDYLWDFGNGNTSNSAADSLNHEFSMPGQYTVVLTVSNEYCIDTMSKIIIVLDFPKPTFKIPNIITPNNDGINDGFHLNLVNATDVQVYIYNRWGQLVGELNDVNDQWYGINNLGQDVVEGVYYFVYEIYGKDNSVTKGDGFFHVVK